MSNKVNYGLLLKRKFFKKKNRNEFLKVINANFFFFLISLISVTPPLVTLLNSLYIYGS